MAGNRPSPHRAVSAAIDHPSLAQALVTLARSLDRRGDDAEDAPGYLELAVLVSRVQGQFDDLTRILVHHARRHESATWKEIAESFSISRPTAYKRFGDPSENDIEAGSEIDDRDDA